MASPAPPSHHPQYPTPQHLQQFLSTALSQRGPASLPYTEDTKLLIRSHLISLFSSYPSLFPKSSVFTHNDGRSVNLLKADGTIPISYHGHSYNIPASIWLLESYPRHPPLVFLTPTPNMSVKANHPYVDQSCSVHVPYLRSWIYPSSNLVDLVRSMSHLFSQDPPLYTRQPSPSLSPSPSPSPNPSPSPRPPPMAAIQQQQRPAPMEDPAEVYRRNAINKILESVQGDMVALRKAQEAEMEGLFGTQAELRRREQEILRGMREMVEEKEGLEQQLQVVLMNSDVLESWVRENDGKRRQRDLDVDNVFEPLDSISKQMLECTAADLAVEDVVYSLDRAVQEGAIPFEMYLKSVRALSREQFFHRALAAKVRAAQMEAQVAGMAARAPPPPQHYGS